MILKAVYKHEGFLPHKVTVLSVKSCGFEQSNITTVSKQKGSYYFTKVSISVKTNNVVRHLKLQSEPVNTLAIAHTDYVAPSSLLSAAAVSLNYGPISKIVVT